jgi:excisionase family DNA binding protein
MEAHAMTEPGAPPTLQAAGTTEWVTVAEAAERLGLNARTLRRAAALGNLESRRSGKVWLTTLTAARAWLKNAGHRPGPRLGQGVGRPRHEAASSSPSAPVPATA